MEEKIFELMTKMYVEMQDMKSCMATKTDIGEVKQEIVGIKEDVAGLKEGVNGLREDLVVVKGNIVGLKQDVSRLENRVMDKVEALFDARDVQMESDAEIVRHLQEVQDKVTELEIRAVREEFKEN